MINRVSRLSGSLAGCSVRFATAETMLVNMEIVAVREATLLALKQVQMPVMKSLAAKVYGAKKSFMDFQTTL